MLVAAAVDPCWWRLRRFCPRGGLVMTKLSWAVVAYISAMIMSPGVASIAGADTFTYELVARSVRFRDFARSLPTCEGPSLWPQHSPPKSLYSTTNGELVLFSTSGSGDPSGASFAHDFFP